MDNLQKVLTELRRQMNGAVSQTMRELGQKDELNFGVSLPTIKEIAMRYAPDHELATLLSQRKSREARIAALYIAEPEKLTTNQMRQWSDGWQNEEIARLSAMLLFHKSPSAADICCEWLNEEPLRRIAAMYIIGKISTQVNEAIIDSALNTADTDAASTFCLREIFLNRSEYRERIAALAKNNSELEWQIS